MAVLQFFSPAKAVERDWRYSAIGQPDAQNGNEPNRRKLGIRTAGK